MCVFVCVHYVCVYTHIHTHINAYSVRRSPGLKHVYVCARIHVHTHAHTDPPVSSALTACMAKILTPAGAPIHAHTHTQHTHIVDGLDLCETVIEINTHFSTLLPPSPPPPHPSPIPLPYTSPLYLSPGSHGALHQPLHLRRAQQRFRVQGLARHPTPYTLHPSFTSVQSATTYCATRIFPVTYIYTYTGKFG